MTMPTRRRLAGAILAAPAFLPALARAQAAPELRISTAAPDASPLSDALRTVKAQMEARFPGAIRVSVHTASSLFRQGTEIPALQRGNLEMATPVTFEIEQQMPEWGALSAAYLFRDTAHMMAVFRGPIGTEFAEEVAGRMGIVILDTAYLGTRTVNLRGDRRVNQPADLNGVRMRMPPGASFQVLARALGATPVSMPITEVYLALRTGAIDGQDNPANMTRDWKFNEVTQQVILTRHLVQPVFIAIAKPVFDRLPAAQQAALRAASRAAADTQIAQTLADEQAALDGFRREGIRIVEPDVAAFRAAVMAEYRRANLTERWKRGLLERIEATG
jgi:tripartite ATP-independent transporter DctP family solute receptor